MHEAENMPKTLLLQHQSERNVGGGGGEGGEGRAARRFGTKGRWSFGQVITNLGVPALEEAPKFQ